MSENIKTILAILCSAIMIGAAVYYQPKVAQVQNQDKVGEVLFKDYGSQYVKRIEVQKYQKPLFGKDDSELVLEHVDLKQSSDVWLMSNRLNFEAGNLNRINSISSILNQLKILEVVSQNPSESDLQQYGLVSPSQEVSPQFAATRLALTVENPNKEVLELLIGKRAKSSGGKQNTYYVRKIGEEGVYRVEIQKDGISGRFIEWISTNLTRMTISPNQPNLYRVVGFDLLSADRLKDNIPPYRVKVDFKNNKAPVRSLQIYDSKIPGKNWISLPTNPMPSELNVPTILNWFAKVIAPQNIALAAMDAKLKPESIRQQFEEGKIQEIKDLGDLKQLGFRFEKVGNKRQLTGESGTLVTSTLVPPFQYHFVYGRKGKEGKVPMLVFAEPELSSIPPAPKAPRKPKSKDEKVLEAYDQQLKSYNSIIEKRKQMIEEVQIAVDAANKRLGKWILYVDNSRVSFAQQPFDFSKHLEKPKTKATKVEASEKEEAKDDQKEKKTSKGDQ